MFNQITKRTVIPPMDATEIEKVRMLQSSLAELPQVSIGTQHILHAGMYSRTIMIPAGVVLTGALIKVATLLIIHGDVTVFIGDKTLDLSGYFVLPASANRKQAFFAKTDTHLTMMFPSKAATTEEAEKEFTDEDHLLFSRKEGYQNLITVTGE